LFSDEEMRLRQMLVRVRHPKLGEINQIGIPMKFSDTMPEVREAPPLIGQQTDEVLQNILHYDTGRIAALHQKRVI